MIFEVWSSYFHRFIRLLLSPGPYRLQLLKIVIWSKIILCNSIVCVHCDTLSVEHNVNEKCVEMTCCYPHYPTDGAGAMLLRAVALLLRLWGSQTVYLDLTYQLCPTGGGEETLCCKKSNEKGHEETRSRTLFYCEFALQHIMIIMIMTF